MTATRGRLVAAAVIVAALPGATALWAGDDVAAHALATAGLLAAAVWAGALRVRWLAAAAGYGAVCAAEPLAWLALAVPGAFLALQGVGITLLAVAALLLVYALAHPRALQEAPRRRDHAVLLRVLVLLAALAVQGHLLLETGFGP